MTVHENLVEWLKDQLKQRAWRPADLARRANIDSGQLSRILNRERRAGPETCLGIARALEVPPERVFRLAGLLPPLPENISKEEDLLYYFRQLDDFGKHEAISIIRTLREARTEYKTDQKGEESR